jgi:predicted nucleic acid-binding Zn ribbon protein
MSRSAGEDDDRDDPLPSDQDSSDDATQVPCPYCRKPISEDANLCPHCDSFVIDEQLAGNRSKWMMVVVIVLIAFVSTSVGLLSWLL